MELCYDSTQSRQAALHLMMKLGFGGCEAIQRMMAEALPSILEVMLRDGDVGWDGALQHLVYCHPLLGQELRKKCIEVLVEIVMHEDDSNTPAIDYRIDYLLHKLELLTGDLCYPSRDQLPAFRKLDDFGVHSAAMPVKYGVARFLWHYVGKGSSLI